MTETSDDLDELSKTVRKIISDNRRFLERVLDEEFEPEDDAAQTEDDEAGEMVEL